MMRFVNQVLAYAAFAAVLGVFSVWPGYRLLDEQQAIVSLTFSHAAQRVEECRRLTQEELNALPPNMRRPEECPRERHDIEVEMRIDDTLTYSGTVSPSGLWKDGKATVYNRTTIDAGEHDLFVGLNDSGPDTGFNYVVQRTVTIEPGQNIVISFDDLREAFVIE
jgi:hypothetical protein